MKETKVKIMEEEQSFLFFRTHFQSLKTRGMMISFSTKRNIFIELFVSIQSSNQWYPPFSVMPFPLQSDWNNTLSVRP
jgi:hypothetical protein